MTRPASLLLSVLLVSSCAPREPSVLHPLVVVGIDGATWDVIDPMMARGELPAFRRLVDRGAGAALVNLPPLVSPVAWTTYATGVFPRRHNILDFTYPYVEGAKRPVDSSLRREPALWNIASDHGRRVGVVGYYVTHPAEVVNGFVVSDALLQLQPGSTYPEELGDRVTLVPGGDRQRLIESFLGWPWNPGDVDDPSSPFRRVSRIVRGRIDGAIVRDENVRRTSLELLSRDVDLFMTYFRLVDHMSHSTWIYYDDSEFERKPDPADRELLKDLIPRAYRYMDRYLAEVLARVGDQTNVIVVSDHGQGSAAGQYAIRDEALAEVLSGNHRYDGLLLAAGPDIEPGWCEGISMMDVTPLALSLMGVPLSRELPGRVPVEMLTPPARSRAAAEPVAAYGKDWTTVGAAPMGTDADEESLEQLKALGYIDQSTRAGRTGPAEPVPFWGVQRVLRRNALMGEVLHALMREDLDEALRVLALTREHDPELAERLPLLVRGQARLIEEEFPFEVFSKGVVARFVRAGAPSGTRSP